MECFIGNTLPSSSLFILRTSLLIRMDWKFEKISRRR